MSFANIRSLLLQEPSTELFSEVCSLFYELDGTELESALFYAEEHMKDWKAEDRCPSFELLSKGSPYPFWPLVQELNHVELLLEQDESPDLSFVKEFWVYFTEFDVQLLEKLPGLEKLVLIDWFDVPDEGLELQDFPTLPNLRHLRLKFDEAEPPEFFSGVSRFQELEVLELERVPLSRELVDELSACPRLQSLVFSGCFLEEYSHDFFNEHGMVFAGIRSLVALTMKGGFFEGIEVHFRDLPSLETIVFERVPVPGISFLSKLSKLNELSLHVCRSLLSIRHLELCTELDSLTVEECEKLHIGSLPLHIGSLTVIGSEIWEQFEDFFWLVGFKSLKHLHMKGCWSIRNVEGLKAMTTLETLVLSTNALHSLQFFEKHTKLRTLDISDAEFDDFSVPTNLNLLEDLILGDEIQVPHNIDLSPLQALKTFECHLADDVETLDFLAPLDQLEKLSLIGNILDIRELKSKTNLKELVLNGCYMRDIRDLGELTRLEVLDLSNCQLLEDVSVIQEMKHLRTLDLSGCKKLKDLSWIRGLEKLEKLVLYECFELDVQPEDEFLTFSTLKEFCKEVIRFYGQEGS